jgi:hypothetical protein
MATPRGRRDMSVLMGIGAVFVLVGVIVAVFGIRWLGIVVALVGLTAFGGLARGRWE